MTGGGSLVRFDHVSCSYGAATVIDDVSFDVREHEFVGIVGPSGGGKTTVLRALLGTVTPVHGRVTHGDHVRLGYVPQVELVDWSFPVTVHNVVSMTLPHPRWRPRRGRGAMGAAGDDRVAGVLDRLGLGDLQRRPIGALSGGQQQRVFLARALVHDPEVLVLDEPAGGVDVAARHEMLHLLADLHHDGTTIVLTTHDLNGLAAHLPRILCLNRTVIADGPPEQVLHPYVLERTYGAPMQVLQHGGMPVVLERHGHGLNDRLRGWSA